MEKFMTHEHPTKVLSLLGLALISLFFMTAVTSSGVAWSGNSQSKIADPFSPKNVVAVIDQTAWVYSNAVHEYIIDPAKADFAFIPENLLWIGKNMELALSVAVGLEEPFPQLAASPPLRSGLVAGAVAYNENVFSLLYRQ